MNQLDTGDLQRYEEYKEKLGAEIKSTAESFVRIGYLLKIARDTDILDGSGYADYLSFAAGEYGLDKTAVSRFIGINDRFSVEGNSEQMLPQYKEYGRAKLQEMLLLPDHVVEELSPDLTKNEISEIKKEYQEEMKITPLEVMSEPTTEDSFESKIIKAIAKSNTHIFEKFHGICGVPFPEKEDIKNQIMPNCDDIWTIRVPGEGKYLCHFKPDTISATNMRSGEKKDLVWDNVLQAAIDTFQKDGIYDALNVHDAWENMFREPWPEEEVAPVQQKVHTEKKKTEHKKPKNDKKTQKTEEKVEKTTNSEEKTSETQEGQKEEPSQEGVNDSQNDVGNVQEVEEKLQEHETPVIEEVTPYETEMAQSDSATVRKEGLMCCDQMRIALNHVLEENEHDFYLRQLKTEHEKLKVVIAEIERRGTCKH